MLLNALSASRRKILIFFSAILAIISIEGTIVYLIEHDANPDNGNIPQAIYWAIVSITTVGYGDIAPVTVLGKVMASVIMLTGFVIIAVPRGIVTLKLGREMKKCACTPPLQRMRLGRSRCSRPPLPAMRCRAAVANRGRRPTLPLSWLERPAFE